MSTNNTEGAISAEFMEWIEQTRPKDVDLDFTPAEAGHQNGYVAGAKAAYRKLTETKAPEPISDQFLSYLDEEIGFIRDDDHKEDRLYRQALRGVKEKFLSLLNSQNESKG